MTDDKTLYAEDVNYWKSSRSSPDKTIEQVKKEIVGIGGEIVRYAFGEENGRAAYLLTFKLDGDEYRITFPVLESRSGNERAARIQATRLLYNDVKAKCVQYKVFGGRAAFAQYLVLSDGQTFGQLTAHNMDGIPNLLPPGGDA